MCMCIFYARVIKSKVPSELVCFNNRYTRRSSIGPCGGMIRGIPVVVGTYYRTRTYIVESRLVDPPV